MKPVRKMLLFGNGEYDQTLWEAIAAELEENHYKNFSELCKAALHQFFLGQGPNQAVLLFIALEKQIASLQHRVRQLEEVGNASVLARLQSLEAQLEQLAEQHQQLAATASHPSLEQNAPDAEQARLRSKLPQESPPDPLLARLGPLLEEF